MQPRKVTILGSTGTIGQNTARLIQEAPKDYLIDTLTAQNNVVELSKQAIELRAKKAVIGNEQLYHELKSRLSGTGIEVAAGSKAIEDAASGNANLIIVGIVGAASLFPTLAAIKTGKTIGLANKECLVCAGQFMMQEVKKHKAQIIPVDSEHNAVFQSFDFAQPERIEKITLTASGGPFRLSPKEKMKQVTPEEAINHPNWKMGAKISVDSATMMNKGLEIIEAYHLFPIEEHKIDVIVHPESIIHCLVYYTDGSVIAGLSNPDMRVPIAYALGWPDRINTSTERLDLTKINKLTFEKPDETKFPALKIARDALKSGGSATTTLNAANEVAVEQFISKKIHFTDITNVVEETLAEIPVTKLDSLEQVFETDKLARKVASKIAERIHN